MGEPPQFLSFDDWVKQVFDHDVRKPEWYWDMDAWNWEGPSDLTVDYLTRLFGQPLPILSNYSDTQLNQGFWYLTSGACSNHLFAVTDEAVSLDARVRCVRSIQRVFEQIFSGLCSQHLLHIDEKGAAPLNLACFMWWDLSPLQLEPDGTGNESISHAALEVMEATLKLDSIACQESALHGLGHWELFYPTEVAKIIDQYLNENHDLRTELKDYALDAREGRVR